MSIDEMTGVQALERKHPGLPMAPGKVERREFEYIRHGTQSFIVSFAVASGRIDTISCGDTRNEDDFVSHIKEVVESSLSASRWHFVADNLNIHKSESLVRYVADISDLDIDLGIKGERGILQSIKTRALFLSLFGLEAIEPLPPQTLPAPPAMHISARRPRRRLESRLC